MELCIRPFEAPQPVNVLTRQVMIAQAMTRERSMGGILQEVWAENAMGWCADRVCRDRVIVNVHEESSHDCVQKTQE
jgi:hypothetical protein